MLALLRERVPPDIRTELGGITNLDEAWAVMEERFGDIDLLVKVVRERLYGLTLKGNDNDQDLVYTPR